MGTLYDKIKSKSGSTTATVSTGSTGGSLYDRIKARQSGGGTTPATKPVLSLNLVPTNFGSTAESTASTTYQNPVNVAKGVFEGAKIAGNFGKEIVQGINRSVGTVGITAANTASSLYNRVAQKVGAPQTNNVFPTSIDTTGSTVTKAVFGDTPVKDLPTYGKAGLDFIEKLTGKKIDSKYAVPLGVLGIVTDLSGMGGEAKKVGIETLQKLAKETSEAVIEKEVKRLMPNLAEDTAKVLTKSIAAEKDYTKVAKLFDDVVKTPVPSKQGVVKEVQTEFADPLTRFSITPGTTKLTPSQAGDISKVSVFHGTDGNGALKILEEGRLLAKRSNLDDVKDKVVSLSRNKNVSASYGDIVFEFDNKKIGDLMDAPKGVIKGDVVKGFEVRTKNDIPVSSIKKVHIIADSRQGDQFGLDFPVTRIGRKGRETVVEKVGTYRDIVEAYQKAGIDVVIHSPAKTYELPKLPPLPQETIRALEKPQVDNTINEAIMTRYRGAVQRPVIEDTALAQAAKLPGNGEGIKKLTGELLTPISSRLGRIHPELKTGIRKFEYEVASKTTHDSQEVLPLLQTTKKMTPEDAALFDLARKNGDSEVIDALAKRYGIEDELNRTRDVLDSIFERAKEVGMDINYRKDYFPRMITNPQKFVAYLRNDPEWSTIRQLIEEAAKKKGIKYTDLTDEEMSALVNNFIRGYGDKVSLSKPGFSKARTLEVIDDKLNQFYESSDSALSAYVIRMNDEIEARKFFGKQIGGDVGEARIDDSIGAYVMKLVAEGKIKPDQEKEVVDILKSRFHRGKMNGALDVYRNLEYISTMGSPISAITQIGDLAFSLFENGFWHTAKGIQKSVSGTGLTKEALGIENITQEFTKDTMSGRALETIFKYSGMEKLDRLGKETLVNGYLSKLKAQANEGSDVLRRELDQMFDPEEAKLALEELKRGELTERTKLLAFNKLLDFQPVAKSEMPQKYLEMPNGRIFYMLKSYSLKQIDVFRTQAIDKIVAGDVKGGMKNLLLLSGALVAANATADEIKDMILGRDTPLSDKVVDNLWRLVGASKYDVYKARTDGVGQTIIKKILFPSSIADRAYIDVQNLLEGKKYEKGPMKGEAFKLESTQDIPFAGKLYYWWFGRGAQKQDYKSGGSSTKPSSMPELPKLPSLPTLPKMPSL